MELEKEIQSKFENEYHKALVNVIYTHSWVTALLKQNLEKYDLTVQQFNILRILRGQHPNPATVNLLKERMLDKMSDASRIVDRLVQKGFVERNVNQRDRRAVDIFISRKGLEVLEKLDPIITPADFLKQNLDQEEAKQLNYLLDKFRG
ncbi:MarR family winged helix-turn-helix transcriptional regulator [Pedobacter sp. SYSU D00535]|uniref:MarR family winged helix-turn-helix transcriptional regulator n=1 Tax=Pedobacter sp. SYSU D00535 TaxID=2810308 RepID=UPI001A97A84F|nr:MarR family transcriptional regulator [Pedobacter sp. SYSU D00535]